MLMCTYTCMYIDMYIYMYVCAAVPLYTYVRIWTFSVFHVSAEACGSLLPASLHLIVCWKIGPWRSGPNNWGAWLQAVKHSELLCSVSTKTECVPRLAELFSQLLCIQVVSWRLGSWGSGPNNGGTWFQTYEPFGFPRSVSWKMCCLPRLAELFSQRLCTKLVFWRLGGAGSGHWNWGIASKHIRILNYRAPFYCKIIVFRGSWSSSPSVFASNWFSED